MASLPKFPISGQIISNNVSLDRISLINNLVGNNNFFAGQYAFFAKNGSIWYKFKYSNGLWSNEFIWIKNASQSNTKFDSNGYPITAYVQPEGEIGLVYFDSNKFMQQITIAASGTLPTVAMNSLDTYVFWVPPNYTDSLMYAELVNSFTYQHTYTASLPGSLMNMQIETIEDDKFMFCFEVDNPGSEKIYVAITDSPD